MKKKILFFLCTALVAGCATTSGKMAAQFLGKHVTVQIDSAIGFPEEITLEGFDGIRKQGVSAWANEIFGKMTGVTLKRRIGDMVAASSQPYTEAVTKSFREKIQEQGVFGAVVDQGGDVALKLEIIRYGLSARDNNLSDLKPLLEIEAKLVAPLVGVVWEDRFDVPEYSTQTFETALDKILNGDVLFKDLFTSASNAAADELVRRMR